MTHRILTAVCIAFLLTGMVRGDDKENKTKPEKKKATSLNLKRLYGDWEYTTGKRGGEEVAKERLAGTVSITKETFTLPAGPEDKFVMTYKIDTTQKPAHIDLKIKSGPVPEGSTVGIIKIEKGQLVLCYDPTGANRPKDFKSTKDDGTFLFTLKRKPKGEKKPKDGKKPADAKKPADSGKPKK